MSTIRVVKFWTKFKPDGQGGMKGIDMVEYCAVGKANMATTVATVSSLGKLLPLDAGEDNPAIKMAHMRWNSIKPQYDAWKHGNEIPLNGIALAAWPGVTSDQAEVLRHIGLRTVEEIAEASDSIITKIPFPGARELRLSAQAFLKSADKAKVASEITKLAEDNDSLRAQLEEMRQIVLEMQGKEDKPKNKRRAAEPAEEVAA
jgi:hypothetical protein